MVKWKLVLAAVVIIAILGLIFTTPASQKITDITGFDLNNLNDFVNPGKILSGLTILLNPLPSGNYFTFILTSDRTIMYGKSFDVENASIILAGNFVTDVFVGETVYDVSSNQGSVSIENFKGTVDFTSFGTIIVSGKATGVSVNNGITVRPSSRDFSIKVEINPSEYFVAPIVQNSLKFTSVSGKLERTDQKSGLQELKNEDIEIIPFIGNVKLSGEIQISGVAKSIKGKTFSWTG